MISVDFHRCIDQIDAQQLGQKFFWGLRTVYPVATQERLREQHCLLRGGNGQQTLGRVVFLYNGNKMIACSTIVRTLFNYSVSSVVSLNDSNVTVLPSEGFTAKVYAMTPGEKRWQIEESLHAIVDFDGCEVGILVTHWLGNEVLGQTITVMPTQTESGKVVQLLSGQLASEVGL